MARAVVVGSGPNGLSAAVALATAGLEVTVLEAADTVGGGARSSRVGGDGVLIDHCSAVHPLAFGSPFLSSLGLEDHGLRWRRAPLDLAHPLDGGSAGVLAGSLAETVDGLGDDGRAWQRTIGWMEPHLDGLLEDLMRPIVHVPRHPISLARYGLAALMPATVLARRFSTPEARALFAGISAHSIQPLERPTTSAIGLMLAAAGHRFGWVIPEGGSQAITDALVSVLTSHGGSITTGVEVTSLAELGAPDVTLLDLAPQAAARIAGSAMPSRVARAYGRWAYGPSAFKVDLEVEGGIPWTNEAARHAGTVHVGGTIAEVAAAERSVVEGRMPERPFVLVGQQYLADPTRSVGDRHPVWTYAHVPHDYDGDATEAVIGQLERFAPGTRDRIVAVHRRDARGFADYDANYVGGDILTGANTPRQVLFRPRVALDPYSTGIPGTYLCSAATPPGAGVHGMAGFNAATRAIRHLGG
jgi:phytoene dehydrogenase-like protein